MSPSEVLAERLKRLDRLAALVYAVATADLPMCPPWHTLTEDQKVQWRAHVQRALRGEHEYLRWHAPDLMP